MLGAGCRREVACRAAHLAWSNSSLEPGATLSASPPTPNLAVPPTPSLAVPHPLESPLCAPLRRTTSTVLSSPHPAMRRAVPQLSPLCAPLRHTIRTVLSSPHPALRRAVPPPQGPGVRGAAQALLRERQPAAGGAAGPAEGVPDVDGGCGGCGGCGAFVRWVRGTALPWVVVGAVAGGGLECGSRACAATHSLQLPSYSGG